MNEARRIYMAQAQAQFRDRMKQRKVKTCLDQEHVGRNPLSVDSFYLNPRNQNTRMSRCMVCQQVRALEESESNLDRHLLRREQEAFSVSVSSEVDEPEYLYSNLCGLVDRFLRRPTPRPSFSRS